MEEKEKINVMIISFFLEGNLTLQTTVIWGGGVFKVSVYKISCDPPFVKWHVQFITVPFKPLSV